MQRVLADIRSYDGKGEIGGNFIIVATFCALLLFAALGSFVASCGPSAYFTKNAAAKAAP